MKDMYVGDFAPEDDGQNTAGGILGNEDKSSSEDLMSRMLLALAAIAVIIYLYQTV